MRKPFIAGNWKMNKTVTESTDYGDALLENLKRESADLGKVDVAVFAPYIHIAALNVIFALRNVMTGAQNMHYEESGAFTGEISPLMLQDLGVDCCIIGHSERRMYFGETDESCAKKVRAAVAHKIMPVLCVGEELEVRESGRHETFVADMVKGSLAGVTAGEVSGSVIAYEPVWAIGTGKTASSQQAQDMASHIRSVVGDLYGSDIADGIRILYGGSVKSSNIAELMAMDDIDGALVGGASLDAAEFAKIVSYSPEVRRDNAKVVSIPAR